MSWLVSIGVGLCAGIVGFVVTLFTAGWAIEWYRVPQREGAAGYLVVGIAICVFFGAVLLGIVCARQVAQGASSPFLKALGTSTVILFATAGISLGLARLLADVPPKMDGRALELAIELRCPPGFAMPSLNDPSDAYATVLLLSSGDTRMWSRLDVEHARTEDGKLIIPTLLGLDTSQSQKLLSIHLGKERELQFPFDFGAKPAEKDLQWSRWIEVAQPAEGETFQMRYRVQQEPLPPKQLTSDEFEAQGLADIQARFHALTADAPIKAWLDFTEYGMPEDIQKAAATAIRQRPGFEHDLSEAILGDDPALARTALRSLEHFPEAPITLAPVIREIGKRIATSLQALAGKAADGASASGMPVADISTLFSAWMVAVRALQGHDNVTFVPALQEIAPLARLSRQNQIIAIDVLRVASYYLHEWAGIEPLPGDPPPR